MRTPQQNFAILLVSVAASFVIVLSLGFGLKKNYPDLPDGLLGVILACTCAAIPLAVLSFLGLKPASRVSYRMKSTAKQMQTRSNDARQQRLAELAVDPVKRKYIPLVERGESWSDEQIAYHENPALLATCIHLQPVERAMRSAGIETRLLWQPGAPVVKVNADCRINETELRRRFAIERPVRYTMGYQPERHPDDNPWAQLACEECGSVIELVHPEWPRLATKWFPA
jgi:hypothetical protein